MKVEQNYNDGVIYFYKSKNTFTSFQAVKNPRTEDDLEYVSKYFYREETRRQQDIAFAGSSDRKLSLKVSIPYCDNLQCDYISKIGNYLYSVFHVDPDKKNNKTYVYLEGMRKVER